MAFEEKAYRVKAAAGFVNSYVTSVVAFLNGTFSDSSIFTSAQAYNENNQSRIYHCPGLKMLPEDFFKISEVLLESMNPDELIKASRQLILTTRKFLKEHVPKIEEEHNPNNEEFLGWYNELSLSFRRIRYFADRASEAERTIRKILAERGMEIINYKSADELAFAL